MGRTKLRVIQGYTGRVAVEQIKLIAAHPGVELVGALVHHAEKVGKDAGEIAGIEPLNVIATDKLDDILALEADAVLYNPPTDSPDEIIAMLSNNRRDEAVDRLVLQMRNQANVRVFPREKT